jgi:hypothetical protein
MQRSMTRIRTSHVGRLPSPKGWEDMPGRLAKRRDNGLRADCHRLRIDAVNHALTDIPEEMVRYHLWAGAAGTGRTRMTCRSNTSST